MEHTIRDCPQREQRTIETHSSRISSEVGNIFIHSEIDEIMKMVKFEIRINDEVHSMDLPTRLDSGSPISLIKRGLVNPTIINVSKVNCSDYSGINNSKLKIYGHIIAEVNLGKGPKEIELFVVDDMTMKSAAILGRDAFKKFNLKLVESVESVDLPENEILKILKLECLKMR